ncbi:hypothetical protein [Peribacillus frigoritolerans]|uniref:hypothetical protein n=1 Tax=Peribacillus frigoritolerans TaxID=450367 RepID=UPI0007BF4FE2|nr:hypothetical protein [Peribacillus frigoritolerans]
MKGNSRLPCELAGYSRNSIIGFKVEQKGKHFDPSIVMSFFCHFDEKAAQKKGCDTVRSTGI